MIAILASVLSLAWLAVLFTQFTPFSHDPDRVGSLLLLVAIDVVVFLLGLVSLAMAARRVYSWRIAALFAATPLLHWLGSTLDAIGGVIIVVPSCLILVVVGVQQIRTRRSHA